MRGISFSCTVIYYNECYEGEVSVAENGDTDIKITSPEGLSGLILHFKGDDATAEYSGFNYKYNISEMPEVWLLHIFTKCCEPPKRAR